MFVALNMFKTELTAPLESNDTVLPIPQSEANTICEALGDECVPCGETGGENPTFTRLVIYHNGYNEIVKVTGCAGGKVIIERGDECTDPRKFPMGACVQFIWTAANLQCAIVQVASGYTISDCEDMCGSIDLGEGVPGPQGATGPAGPAGPAGADGADGTNGINGADGTNGVDGLPGQDGINGVNGINGTNGTNGTDGRGVTGATVNISGELIIYYSDGTSQNVGVVKGADGANGADGADGADGLPGADGADPYTYYLAAGGALSEPAFASWFATTPV